MSRDPVTSQADDDLEKLVDLLEEHHGRRIPVVDENNQTVGIITQADIVTRAREPETTCEVFTLLSCKHKKTIIQTGAGRETALCKSVSCETSVTTPNPHRDFVDQSY